MMYIEDSSKLLSEKVIFSSKIKRINIDEGTIGTDNENRRKIWNGREYNTKNNYSRKL